MFPSTHHMCILIHKVFLCIMATRHTRIMVEFETCFLAIYSTVIEEMMDLATVVVDVGRNTQKSYED